MGALLFVYWVLIPANEKQRILNEIYNSTNYSNSYISEEKNIQLNHVYLKSGESRVVLTQNYLVGDNLVYDEEGYPGFSLDTTLFRGSKQHTIFLPGCEKCNGVILSFNSSCENCNVEIYLNDQLIYSGEGLPNSFSRYVPKDFLSDKNVLKFVLKPPTNPFVESKFIVTNLSVKYVTKSVFIGNFYYYGGKAYLDYNFCPAAPQSLELYINNRRIYFPSCSSNLYGSKLYITPYLKQGYNEIKVYSRVPAKISLSIDFTEPKFFYFFDKPQNGIIYLFVEDGSGVLRINNCTFTVNQETTLINARSCLMDYNGLVLEAKPYINVEKIVIT